MSTTTTKLLTAEDFWLLPGGEHSVVVIAFGTLLRQWAKQNGAGVVGTEAGFILDRGPDVVRAPDLYFVRTERLPAGRIPTAFYDLAPDLAVEVVSPSETAEDVQGKIRDYLAAGTALVVLVYPRARLLIAHAPDGSARTYREDERFDAPLVLPGFSSDVSELFA